MPSSSLLNHDDNKVYDHLLLILYHYALTLQLPDVHSLKTELFQRLGTRFFFAKKTIRITYYIRITYILHRC